jgi:sec-independent protein translocase protein TatA
MFGILGMNSPWEWGVVLLIVLIFFGVGKLPAVLGQMGKGVKAFKDGMKDREGDARATDADDADAPARQLDVSPDEVAARKARHAEAEEVRR